MTSLLSLLNSSNYRTYSLVLAKKLKSVLAAIYLGELIQRYEFHQENKDLITLRNQEGKWFYFTESKCEERTGLTHDNQETAIKTLVKFGLIKKMVAGLPSKRHFQLNELAIFELLLDSKNLSSLEESAELGSSIPPNFDGGFLPSTKETKKEPLSKKTTTKKKDSSSFLDRDLKELNELDLTPDQKSTLYKKFEDSTILQAIECYKSKKKIPDDLGAFLYNACLKNWKPTATKEKKLISNKEIAQAELKKLKSLTNSVYDISMTSKAVVYTAGIIHLCAEFDQNDFEEKFKQILNRVK